jgi:regulator of replication initiation timing
MSEAIFAAMEKLERELAEAKQEIERLDTRGIHSCHDNCQRPMCVLRRENTELRAMLTKTQGEVTISRNGYVEELEQQRDEALSDLEFRRDLYKIQTKRLDDVCEQRDRLAEALRKIKNELGVPQPEYPAPVANAVKIADEALAAVKGEAP